MEILSKIFFYSYLLVSFLLTFKNKKNLLYSYVISLPFFGLMMDVGLQIDITKFISLLTCLILLYHLPKIPRKLSPILTFIIYIVSITIVMSMFLPESVSRFPLLRGKYRWVFQIFMWLLMFVPLFYSQIFIKNIKEVEKLYKFLLFSLVIVSLLGFIQIFSFYFLDFDPFPISILYSEEHQRTASFQSVNNLIFRMSSVGGEPKHLAYSLVMGLTILFAHLISRKNIFSRKIDIFVFFILLVAMLLTFSTQGYILFFLNIVILLIYYKNIKSALILIIGIFALTSLIGSTMGFSLNDLFKTRILRDKDEVSIVTYTEDSNETVIGFLKDYPGFLVIGSGLGNIHLWAQNYIPDYAEYYMYGNVFVAKSGFLRLLSETGVIGLLLFFYGFLKPFYNLKKQNAEIKTHLIISFLIFLDFLLSADGPNYITFAFIIIYILYKNPNLKVKEIL